MVLQLLLSSSRSTVSPSVPWRNSVPRQSQKVGGFHGKFLPVQSSDTASRPSTVMVSPVAPSRITNEGIPRTLNFFESAFLMSRFSKGTASQGIFL